MSFNLFYTGRSGLNVAQSALVTTAHNTANVNTEGYSRQSAQISSSTGNYIGGIGFFGNGAQATDVTRSYDQFLTRQLNQAQSSNESLSTQYAQISQIDNLLANQTASLSPLMQGLFTSVQAVANTPADPAARQQLLGSAEAMTNQFRATSLYLSGLNTNVNEQIVGYVEQINTYATQIADLNQQIALVSNAGAGHAPNDLLDQRDLLVSDLSKLVGTKVVVQSNGQYSVFVGNGQTLVLGDKAASLKAIQSSSDPSQNAIAMIGTSGLTMELQDSVLSGGALGGLLQFRNETLSNAQNSLGRIAIALSDTFNAQQRLGVDLNGALGANFFSQSIPETIANDNNKGDLTLTAKFADVGDLSTSDYKLQVEADGTFSLTRLSDKRNIALPAGFPSATTGSVSFDGLTLSFDAGSVQPGDSFLIQPTRAGARDLAVLITEPGKIAAASAIVVDNTFGNKGSGKISGGSIDASYAPLSADVTLTYDSASNTLSGFPDGSTVPYVSGEEMQFNGITFTLSGAPVHGDSFTIAHNTSGVSDGRNALLLAGLQNQKTIGGKAASFNAAYAQLVSTIGNKTRQIEISNTAQSSLTVQIRAVQQSISGVNQDEETANLLMYQQMYQANAKVIQTASTLFDAILGISR
ncbi:MAG: flagellar hook-associated protein FlgK [Rhodoferax sp.]|nr:flagellar hook-associated protein FlgK [Rhodoferax sp.]